MEQRYQAVLAVIADGRGNRGTKYGHPGAHKSGLPNGSTIRCSVFIELRCSSMSGYEPISQSERYFESASNRGTDFPKGLVRGIPVGEVRTVLDVGCGEGLVTKFLSEELRASVVGIEPSENVAQKLNERYEAFESLHFESSLIWDLPFNSQSFDLVVAKGILPWIEPKLLVRSLMELGRVSDRYLLLWDKFACED